MAVTIIDRPEGQVLSPTPNTATVNSSYGTGDATFVHIGHGMDTGDEVYTESNIENYAGFFQVVVINADRFKLAIDTTYYNEVQYIQDGEITYYKSTLEHGWSAVHLPITYRLSSDKYPFNSVDLRTEILSFSNDGGYVLVNLQDPIGDVNRFDWVTLSVTGDPDLDGIYQVMDWINDTVIVINLAYDTYPTLVGAFLKKAYNNYNVLVRVYAGISSGHEWANQKPYELAGTLELIPFSGTDIDNELFFSINEILKSYIETKNNPNIGTQPNNIDFWTNFYIEVAESYDDSDGYNYGTYTSEYTSDQENFEGYAVNANLEFKNIYSGFMSDYIMDGSGKFLTLFDEPVLFSGNYQDISFIKDTDNAYTLNLQYYLNGVSALIENQIITGDQGVYRIPLVANCAYDRLDISIFSDDTPEIESGTGSLIFTGYAPTIFKQIRPGVGQVLFTGFVPIVSNLP